jgi:zinc transport system ATP-binding protein
MSLVDISHLDYAYPAQRTRTLQHIDLKIEQGSVLGLIGPNGSGKTTLIKLLLGLLSPTRGTIAIDGCTPREAVRRGNVIGYLPQNPPLPESFPIDVRQLVRLGLVGKTGPFRSTLPSDLDFVESLLAKIGIEDLAEVPVGDLSGGQLQRALIARALAPRPKLLLLDEPTTGLDSGGQKRFIEFMQQLRQELKLTIVFVSHDLRAVSAISDRIACLNASLHYHDTPDHLPADLVYRMFACDLEAMGIKGAVSECTCDTPHASATPGERT